jgi:hypothetical protein
MTKSLQRAEHQGVEHQELEHQGLDQQSALQPLDMMRQAI